MSKIIFKRYACNSCERSMDNLKDKCKPCSDGHYKSQTIIVNEIPYGTLVRLNKKAIKDFYGTDYEVDCHMRGKIENGDMDFVSFFGNYRFNLGLDAGIVVGLGASDCHVAVKFFTVLGEWKTRFYSSNDLEELD